MITVLILYELYDELNIIVPIIILPIVVNELKLISTLTIEARITIIGEEKIDHKRLVISF